MFKAICFVGFIFLLGCQSTSKEKRGIPVAQVADKTLTLSELQKVIPKNLKEHDSITFVQTYINRWVKTELLLRKSELNLTPEEQDVTQILDDYRSSLLIHKYQQKYLLQNHAPLLKTEEIEAYYELMKEDFRLSEQVILGLYIKVPKVAPDQNLFRKWYRSENPEDLEKTIEYSHKYAKAFDNFMEEWIPVAKISENMPNPIPERANFLRYNSNFETSDEEFNYYVSVRDYRLEDDVAPIEYVVEKIKAILLNKKRNEFIHNLENDLYQEGLKQQIVKIY